MITPPRDTVVVTPPKDSTGTQPPKDTTTTLPPKDTSLEASYKYVLQGIGSASLLYDSTSGFIAFSMGSPSGTDIQVETGISTDSITVELHASHPMQVTQVGSTIQGGTWDNQAGQYDPTKLIWADTTGHPYFRMVDPKGKQIIIGLFTKNGLLGMNISNKIGSNETVREILSGKTFKAVRIKLL